jgi:2-polyprenyl-3-methyl-5-hydroxy-6-metoxy-1,4-benzoquinol methylase
LRLKGRGDHERKGDRQSKDLTEEEMQVGDSGMPDEAYWSSLFDMAGIVDWLVIPEGSNVVDIGCGYGTFTVPVVKKQGCNIHAFDIDPLMIATAPLKTIHLLLSDTPSSIKPDEPCAPYVG